MPGFPRIVHWELRPSTATRGTHAPAHCSMPGAGFYGPDHRRIYYDSNLERKAQLTCMLDPTVLDFRDQWPVTQFIDPVTGGVRDHTWDFALKRNEGWEVVFVKPIPIVLQYHQDKLFALIADFVDLDFVVSARLMTELDLNPELVDLSEMLNFSMMAEEPSRAGKVRRMILEAPGLLTVRQIVHSFIPDGLHATERPAILSDAYWSVVHTIARRQAFLASPGYFNMDTMISAHDGVVAEEVGIAA